MNLEKFTDRARKVLSYAKEEAKKEGHDAVYTHDLLVGLLREPSGVAHFVLENFDLSIKKIRDQFRQEHGKHQREVESPEYTILFKEVLNLAIEEATNLKHNYVGTEHLLLAMAHMPILTSCGLNRDEVLKETMTMLGEHPYTFSPIAHTYRVEIIENSNKLGEYDTEEKKLTLWDVSLNDVSKIVESVEKYEERKSEQE